MEKLEKCMKQIMVQMEEMLFSAFYQKIPFKVKFNCLSL